MLTDEELMEIRNRAKLNSNRQIDPLPFARDVIEAVLAKAIAQQDRRHKEWCELWSPIDDAVRPLTPLGESVAAKALELINMAKAMPIPKQEPIGKICKSAECGGVDFYFDKIPDGETMLYAGPQPAQAASIPEQWRVTGYGQIKKGDVISMVMAGRRICTSAKEVLNTGTSKEEIVYNRKKNHYFITSMVLDGTSNHKDVFIIPADLLSASPKPE